MFYTQFQHPQIMRWQARLARVPRWAWIAFFIGVIVPIVVLGASLLLMAVVFGGIALAAALLVGGVVRTARRLGAHRSHAMTSAMSGRPNPSSDSDDGRRNVRVVITSARVIDP